jgi:AraC-like DNA-binding protein
MAQFPRFEKRFALNGEEIPRPKGWTQRMYQVAEGPFRFEKETFEICDGLFIEDLRLVEGSIRIDGVLDAGRLRIGIFHSEEYRLLGNTGSSRISTFSFDGSRWDATAKAPSSALTFNVDSKLAEIIFPPEKREALLGVLKKENFSESIVIPVSKPVSDLERYMRNAFSLGRHVDLDEIDQDYFEWLREDFVGLASSLIDSLIENGERDISVKLNRRRIIAHEIEDALWEEPINNEHKLSLSYFSEKLGFSKRTIQLAIQENFNMGFNCLRRAIRLHQVNEALQKQPNKRVSEVAQEYEFEHHGRFALEFKEMFGVSPSKLSEKS